MKININDYVRVKPKKPMRLRYQIIRADLIRATNGKYKAPEEIPVDADGYHRIQFWELMQDYGNLCGMGRETPFACEMLYDTEGQ